MEIDAMRNKIVMECVSIIRIASAKDRRERMKALADIQKAAAKTLSAYLSSRVTLLKSSSGGRRKHLRKTHKHKKHQKRHTRRV
jgi:hypothetical protein